MDCLSLRCCLCLQSVRIIFTIIISNMETIYFFDFAVLQLYLDSISMQGGKKSLRKGLILKNCKLNY